MESKLPRYELIFDEDKVEGVFGVSLVSDAANEEFFIRFSKEEKVKVLDETIIDNILLKGEKIELSDWELIDETVVDGEDVYNIDLASIPAHSDSDSEQDNELFKVRYEYSPNKSDSDSRSFCVKMASSGLSFRKEDLVMSNANPGFGAGGSDTYNIFLYKGGVNCQHFWTRKIYLKKNNKKMSVYEALKYIGGLDKKTARQAKFETNPSEVSQVASSSNNYWKLSTEIKDFKMASEEKRILTCPVLIPEQNIYRNLNGEECDVFASAETIERLQQNFFKKEYQKNSTIEHKEVIDGVFFFESWIVTNPKNDKATELGFNVPKGTWMMSMKVENQKIWDEFVKTGLVTGFSIDSRLGIQKNKIEKMNYSKVREMVDAKAKELVMEKILLAAQLKEFKIDDTLSVFAESLDKDMVVFDKDNNPLANTKFTLDGKNYETDENGVISIIEDVKEEQKEEQKPEDDALKMADENAPAPADENAPADTPDAAKLQEELDLANKKIQDLETENQSLKAELVSIKEETVKLAKQPKVEGINLNDTQKIDLSSMTSLERYRYLKSN